MWDGHSTSRVRQELASKWSRTILRHRNDIITQCKRLKCPLAKKLKNVTNVKVPLARESVEPKGENGRLGSPFPCREASSGAARHERGSAAASIDRSHALPLPTGPHATPPHTRALIHDACHCPRHTTSPPIPLRRRPRHSVHGAPFQPPPPPPTASVQPRAAGAYSPAPWLRCLPPPPPTGPRPEPLPRRHPPWSRPASAATAPSRHPSGSVAPRRWRCGLGLLPCGRGRGPVGEEDRRGAVANAAAPGASAGAREAA